eukprot:11662931-Heterocapsa_arctica.AAC.1
MESAFLSLLVTHFLRAVIRSVMNSGLKPDGPGPDRGGSLIILRVILRLVGLFRLRVGLERWSRAGAVFLGSHL